MACRRKERVNAFLEQQRGGLFNDQNVDDAIKIALAGLVYQRRPRRRGVEDQKFSACPRRCSYGAAGVVACSTPSAAECIIARDAVASGFCTYRFTMQRAHVGPVTRALRWPGQLHDQCFALPAHCFRSSIALPALRAKRPSRVMFILMMQPVLDCFAGIVGGGLSCRRGRLCVECSPHGFAVAASASERISGFRTYAVPIANYGLARHQLSAGDPGWIRTSDPQLRRLMLYPAELRGLLRSGLPATHGHEKTHTTVNCTRRTDLSE
jgi:hypothetical protein